MAECVLGEGGLPASIAGSSTKFLSRPERANQDSPGQSGATPWVKRQKGFPALKGRNHHHQRPETLHSKRADSRGMEGTNQSPRLRRKIIFDLAVCFWIFAGNHGSVMLSERFFANAGQRSPKRLQALPPNHLNLLYFPILPSLIHL